jgi:mRNA interferase MazF
MTFERGDVVYGADPFKGSDYSRPWLVISNTAHPFHGEQYIVLALTTKTWHDDLLSIGESQWTDGGTPKDSSIVPWSIETLEHADIGHWQGTIVESVVTDAVDEFVTFVRAE